MHMGNRYLITGVQLAMLSECKKSERKRLMKEILDEQWVGETDNPIRDDVKVIINLIEGTNALSTLKELWDNPEDEAWNEVENYE